MYKSNRRDSALGGVSLQDSRFVWILIAFCSAGLVLFSHYFFQGYLFMRPCEQCVYIRYAMFVIALGAFVACLFPSLNAFKFIGFVFGFYGVIVGIDYALTLNSIYEAIESANPFGASVSCKKIPTFPFDLPLHLWFPTWFTPIGECGLDMPYVPLDSPSELSSIQQFFIGSADSSYSDGLYSKGWKLIPSLDFMNMATFCLVYFIVVGLLLVWLLLSFIKKQGLLAFDWSLAILVTTTLLVSLSYF